MTVTTTSLYANRRIDAEKSHNLCVCKSNELLLLYEKEYVIRCAVQFIIVCTNAYWNRPTFLSLKRTHTERDSNVMAQTSTSPIHSLEVNGKKI